MLHFRSHFLEFYRQYYSHFFAYLLTSLNGRMRPHFLNMSIIKIETILIFIVYYNKLFTIFFIFICSFLDRSKLIVRYIKLNNSVLSLYLHFIIFGVQRFLIDTEWINQLLDKDWILVFTEEVFKSH